MHFLYRCCRSDKALFTVDLHATTAHLCLLVCAAFRAVLVFQECLICIASLLSITTSTHSQCCMTHAVHICLSSCRQVDKLTTTGVTANFVLLQVLLHSWQQLLCVLSTCCHARPEGNFDGSCFSGQLFVFQKCSIDQHQGCDCQCKGSQTESIVTICL